MEQCGLLSYSICKLHLYRHILAQQRPRVLLAYAGTMGAFPAHAPNTGPKCEQVLPITENRALWAVRISTEDFIFCAGDFTA